MILSDMNIFWRKMLSCSKLLGPKEGNKQLARKKEKEKFQNS